MADQGGVVDEARKSSLAEDFCAITASTTETALFFLESHNWNLDSAIHSFFEADEDDHHDALAEEAPSLPPPGAIPRPNMPPPSAAPRPNIPYPSAAPVPNASMSKKASSGGGGGRPVIRTLADLNRQSGAGSDSDDSDGPVEHYTGGDKSGMLVQDPSKGNHDVDAIFEQARQMGALDGPSEHRPSSSSRSFTGTGRLLSGGTVVPASPQRPEDVIHDIIFWTNGFTVNDGPLRRFEDPENAPFLESIGKSECPKELEPADRRSEVNVNLIRKTEKFPEPPKRSAAFQGVGRTLGEGSASGSAVVQPTIAAAAAAAAAVAAPDLSIGLSVDASLPATSLQLRLADGTRMVARFNMSHTVGHIRAFIDASRPFALRTYQLQTVGFPPKQLADSTQTIEQAGLANSVIVQKL